MSLLQLSESVWRRLGSAWFAEPVRVMDENNYVEHPLAWRVRGGGGLRCRSGVGARFMFMEYNNSEACLLTPGPCLFHHPPTPPLPSTAWGGFGIGPVFNPILVYFDDTSNVKGGHLAKALPGIRTWNHNYCLKDGCRKQHRAQQQILYCWHCYC